MYLARTDVSRSGIEGRFINRIDVGRATMASWARGLTVLVFALAAIMVVPTAAATNSHAEIGTAGYGTTGIPGSSSPVASHSLSTAGAPAAQRILDTLRADHVPMKDVFLPNLNSHPTVRNGVVTPLYTTAPAPMGLGYFGLHQVGGHNVGTISYTSSIEGAATLKSVNPLYVASSSPDIFTMQLNTVLAHVDVANNSSGVYWIQNVPIYYAQSQTLGIEDNIWNFSSAGAGMPASTLYSYSGQVVAPVFYYAVGPSWHMPTPFTIRLFNNATVFHHRPTVYFNYSITAANGSVISGSFDRVEFNSTGLTPPTGPAPTPTFQINGKATNAFGLLNDAEIMLGGPGGGSTTTIFNINGSMGLWTLPNGTHTYQAVPSGYSFGTDTGETSEGITEWASGGAYPMAMLGPGPSLLQPLWGVTGAHSGFVRERFTIAPSNAFVFASPGSAFRMGTAAWAPVPPNGAAVYLMTPGTYTFKFLLSDHRAKTTTVHGSATLGITLPWDNSKGVYTPLWAWNDAQLQAISQPGGQGTLQHPYYLINNVAGPINPLFGEFNDYYYPVFPGIFLANTDAHVIVNSPPSFSVTYSLPVEASFSAQFGTPFSNNLELEFYNASHIALWNATDITGWFFAQDPYFSNVLFWNCNWDVIGGNAFHVQSTALILYGGTHNTIWGNTFTSATTTAQTPATILNGANQNALQLYESGDLVYNNAFLTPVTAVTPGFDFYSGAPASWADRWNVSRQPATDSRLVPDGLHLTGSILGTTYEGGNEWGNYGTASNPYGVLPYNNGGGITSGGDYVPLIPFTLYRVVFTETGLPAGTTWNVTLGNLTLSTNATTLTFWEPAGLYAFSVGLVPGHHAHPHLGAVKVPGIRNHVSIRWT